MENLIPYNPLYQQDKIKLGTGRRVVVATGWTTIDNLDDIPDYLYAAMGTLYSKTSGVKYLIYNLLANPQIDALVYLCGSNLDKSSGTADVMENIFVHRTVKSIEGVSEEDLGNLVRNVTFHCVDKVVLVDAFLRGYSLFEADRIKRQAVIIEEPDNNDRIQYPAAQIGHLIKCHKPIHGYQQAVKRVVNCGSEMSKGLELLNLQVVIEEPTGKRTGGQYFTDQELLDYYSAAFEYNGPSPKGSYTYIERLHAGGLFFAVMKLLTKDSTQSYVSLWHPLDDYDSPNPPCLTGIALRLIDQKLHMTAWFRSHDIYGAWLKNAAALGLLMRRITQDNPVKELNMQVGTLTILSHSAHIYSHDLASASKIANLSTSPCLYADPAGNFVVNVHMDGVNVQWWAPDMSRVIKGFDSKSAERLMDSILEECPYMEASHAAYLGMTINEAFHCLETGKEFVQT
jgi:thymidylate synthase